jgi:hypothetical protein
MHVRKLERMNITEYRLRDHRFIPSSSTAAQGFIGCRCLALGWFFQGRPEERFEEFALADAQISSENKATQRVIPMIQGAIRDDRYVDGRGIAFNNLVDILRGRGHKAKPDVYYGARPEQLDREVRKNLSSYIEPSSTDSRPYAPNFFVEAKGPKGSAGVGLDQACFAGAVGARGMHSLQTYGQDHPTYDNKAYTITSTYHAGTLKIYAHHPSQPDSPASQPEYYINQVKAWALTSDRETLLKGVTAFRNAEGWTEAQRNAAIEYANVVARAKAQANEDETEDEDEDENENESDDEDELAGASLPDPVISSFASQSPFSTSHNTYSGNHKAHQEPETSADELALDLKTTSKRPKRGKHSRRPTRNAGRSSSRHSSAVAASQQAGRWAWTNGAFQCYEDRTLLQSQNSVPGDVWVYYEHGRPDGGGKQWRRWLSTTGQMQYQ